MLGLLVPYAVDELGVDVNDGRIGLLYAAIGLGSLTSGLLFSRVFRPTRVPAITPLSIGASGLLALGLAGTDSWVSAIVLVALFSLFVTTTIMVGITFRQLVVPDEAPGT